VNLTSPPSPRRLLQAMLVFAQSPLVHRVLLFPLTTWLSLLLLVAAFLSCNMARRSLFEIAYRCSPGRILRAGFFSLPPVRHPSRFSSFLAARSACLPSPPTHVHEPRSFLSSRSVHVICFPVSPPGRFVPRDAVRRAIMAIHHPAHWLQRPNLDAPRDLST